MKRLTAQQRQRIAYARLRIDRLIAESRRERPHLPKVKLMELAEDGHYAYCELGFGSYEEYLKSRLWKRIKERVLNRDHHKCSRCGGGAKLVHHRSYHRAVMAGDADEYLASVCEGCHNVIEIRIDDRGCPQVRSLIEKDAELLNPEPSIEFPQPEPHPWRAGVQLKDLPSEWPRMSSVQRECWFHMSMAVARIRNRRPPTTT